MIRLKVVMNVRELAIGWVYQLKNESKAATDFLKKLVLNRAQSLPNLGR
jgi:hypothetical protein